MECGGAAVVIATGNNRLRFARGLEALGANLPELLGTRRLVFLDAMTTLACFLVHGEPVWEGFEKTISSGPSYSSRL